MKAHRCAKHLPRTVCTDNCHLSFPWASVGGQAYECFRSYVAPCTLDLACRARGICPRDTLKPRGKRASPTFPTLLSSPLQHIISTIFSQALPWTPTQGKFRQGWVWSPRPLCLRICSSKATNVKKTQSNPNNYQHCRFAAVILKRRNSSELLYTWLQPLNQTYSQTFFFIVLLSFFWVLEKPELQCLATQKPKEASTKPANTSHPLTNVIKKSKTN